MYIYNLDIWTWTSMLKKEYIYMCFEKCNTLFFECPGCPKCPYYIYTITTIQTE